MGLAMGYYFVFMGRSQSYSLAVTTVFSRVLFVPLALIFLILLKELDFRFIAPVLITDFVLGFGTLYLILKEKFKFILLERIRLEKKDNIAKNK